ncbi:hypothetical protein [Mesorhizobium sp.]|uniref:hypothetical protein n=1 Tax=Mesorhizobium sp. TaxID=1871066 RepID=UPI000FE9697D|nr:hypothetical protein [Mesorhizobium sp.]RWI22047.1 MAG: hypothetical protein EOQ92_18805 [Mesorhizobium sp.]RWK46094.1 MAG: hypothetical protein EOR47_27705 [Mesorhizobium sp.]RWK85248.1 MAG: hypothetical protein EOR45_30775 [Mesorhizobium sp.]RWK92333.1 MAG: hypothetical protein EOR53_26835 [Mesorhizobium sp.]TIP57764.1 MAG: hypothetical protein E5X56_18385 [Mesorhizobium sp.]
MSPDPQRELWVRVILQATMDATTVVGSLEDAPATVRANRLASITARNQARAWFRPKNKDFIHVCNLAGMDPNSVAERAAAAMLLSDEAAARGEKFTITAADSQPSVKSTVATYKHDGKSLTIAEWAELTGIRAGTLRSRIQVGHPMATVLSTTYLPKGQTCNGKASFNRRGRPAKLYTFNGASKSLSRWSNDTGIKLATLVRRMKQGATIELALTAKDRERPKKLHTIDGVSKSLAQWADHAGVRYNTLIARLGKGRTLAEAVAMSRGVVSNLPASVGTGGGSLAQEGTNIGISE